MEQCLKTFFNSSVPEPFTILISVSTSDPFGLETLVHRHFCKSRKYGRKKEFFVTPREEIVEFFGSLGHDQRQAKEGELCASASRRKRKAS
jgi:hypothetical protein